MEKNILCSFHNLILQLSCPELCYPKRQSKWKAVETMGKCVICLLLDLCAFILALQTA